MNIIEYLKSLPKGKLAVIDHLPVPDDYSGRKTDDFIALAESHERLLAAAQGGARALNSFVLLQSELGSTHIAEGTHVNRLFHEQTNELNEAVEQAEKL